MLTVDSLFYTFDSSAPDFGWSCLWVRFYLAPQWKDAIANFPKFWYKQRDSHKFLWRFWIDPCMITERDLNYIASEQKNIYLGRFHWEESNKEEKNYSWSPRMQAPWLSHAQDVEGSRSQMSQDKHCDRNNPIAQNSLDLWFAPFRLHLTGSLTAPESSVSRGYV